jgi:hypothetical protein
MPNALRICAADFAALSCAMPWRRKPVSQLCYWSSGGGAADFKAHGFKTILVYCVGLRRRWRISKPGCRPEHPNDIADEI